MNNILDIVQEKWNLLTAFSKKQEIKELLWDEIVYRYSEQHRHYHNLTHLAYLFNWCDQYLDRLKNPAVVGFAVFYHDIIYDTYRHDNEEQSAAIAAEHLKELSVNASVIENVQLFIKATKNHEIPEGLSLHEDLGLFLDFDMAILGADAETYQRYSENIRQEYAKYNDQLYREGRKFALKKILSSNHIFITEEFRDKLEARARENISREINLL
jgi:predicted metal-dependent HD superfamily phosphohydrolase